MEQIRIWQSSKMERYFNVIIAPYTDLSLWFMIWIDDYLIFHQRWSLACGSFVTHITFVWSTNYTLDQRKMYITYQRSSHTVVQSHYFTPLPAPQYLHLDGSQAVTRCSISMFHKHGTSLCAEFNWLISKIAGGLFCIFVFQWIHEA